MSALDDAARLEALFPRVLAALFHTGEDPLRHNSIGQVKLMRALLAGCKTASELSQTLGLSPSSLTQMASRLISAGLISKELDRTDRRVRKLSLTDAGRAMMEGRQDMRARAGAKLLATMDPRRVVQLIEILEEIALSKPGTAISGEEAGL